MGTRVQENMSAIVIPGNLSDHVVGVTKPTIDRILKAEDPADLLALYVFYCYTAKWQRTDQIKATNSFAAKALGWSERTVSSRRQQLEAMELVRSVSAKKDGKVVGWYIRVNFIFVVQNAGNDSLVQNANEPGVDGLRTNASDTVTVQNALRTSTSEQVDGLLESQLNRLRAIFHKQVTTPLDRSEKAAWSTLTHKGKRLLDDGEIAMVERFYKKHWPPNRDKNNLRHALAQMLNNWNGEVAKASAWCGKNKPKAERKTPKLMPDTLPEEQLPPPDMESQRSFAINYEARLGRLPAGWKRDGEGELQHVGLNGANGCH
jgi:hypothetical protein